MDCDTVRRGLGETDGRRPRDRRMRAHLAACQSCAAFGSSIRSRRSALAALAPPLAPAAASDIFARLFEPSSSSSAGVAAGGLAAGAAKLAGASGIAKLAGAAAVAVVGGAVVAGGAALLGPDQVDSRATPPSVAQALLRPDLPALRSMPPPGAEAPSAPGRGGDGPRESGTGANPSTADEPGSPAGPTGDRLPSAEFAQNDPPVDLGAVELPAVSGAELPGTDGSALDVGIEVPGGSWRPTGGVIELPEGSGGSKVEVPDAEVTEPTKKVPDVGSIELPRRVGRFRGPGGRGQRDDGGGPGIQLGRGAGPVGLPESGL